MSQSCSHPSKEPGKGNGPRYLTRNAFDEMSARWSEEDVLCLLDYDRVYAVHGRAVNPYKGPAKALMGQTPPTLPRLTLPPRLVVPVSQQTPPAATTAPTRPPAPKLTPTRKAPPVFDDSDDEETF